MTQVTLTNGREYNIHPTLHRAMGKIDRMVHQDLDAVFLMFGKEGSGKSTVALQLACFLDPSFNLERVCFSFQDFKKQVLNAKKFQAIVYDESYSSSSSRSTSSRENRMQVYLLMAARSRNLFIFLIVPSIVEVDRYVVLHRSLCAIETFFYKQKSPTGSSLRRGGLRYYNRESKELLYLTSKRAYGSSRVRADFTASFSSFFPIDKNAYEKKKLSELSFDDVKVSRLEEKYRLQLRSVQLVLKRKGWKSPEIADATSRYSGQKLANNTIRDTLSLFEASVVADGTLLSPQGKSKKEKKSESGMAGGDVA